jgi:hypothetical protein
MSDVAEALNVRESRSAIDASTRHLRLQRQTSSTLEMAFIALNKISSAPIVPIQAPAPAPAPAPTPAPTPAPHPQEIDVAFASNHELRKRVHAAIGMLLPAIA